MPGMPAAAPPATPPELAGDTLFQHLAESDGLANPVVAGFAEDGDGFLWIATQSGLQRWDGYRLWTYKAQLGVPDSLPDNLTQVLHTDQAGRVWVGTSSGGLARYDRERNSFVRYHNSANGVAPVNIVAIEDDGRGGLWVGSGTGLDHLDPITGNFTHITPTDPAGLPIEVGLVAALLRSADGTLWIGTSKGLLRTPAGTLDGKTFEPVQMPDGGPDVGVDTIFADRAGTVWFGTDHGVYLVDSASYKPGPSLQAGGQAAPPSATHPEIAARRLQASGSFSGSLASEHIVSITGDPQGGIWIGTQDQGVFIVSPATGAIRHMLHDASQPTSLSDDWVYSLYLSRQGIMWIGSRHGVNYLDTTPKGVFTLLGGDASGDSVRDSDIYSVFPRRDGSIWLGLSKHGIDILSQSGRKIGELRPSPASDSPHALPKGTVGAMCEAGDGGVYIVTQHGLYLAESTGFAASELHASRGIAGDQKTSSHAFNPTLSRVPIGTEAAQGLYQVLLVHDAQGKATLWLGGTNGLWTYDPSGPGPAVRASLKKPLTDPRIRVLYRGSDNFLWVGTLNGLNRVDIVTGDVVAIPPEPSEPQGLGAGMIATILTDRKGRLWVGTFSGGVNLLEDIDSNGRARFHRIIDGLPNENVDRLLEATDGTIWASTDGGLAEIDPFNFDIRVLGRAEGAFILTYWDGVGGRSPDGDLFFGGSGGLTVVRPSGVKPWTYAPPVVITSARIGSTDVPLSRFNSGPGEYPVWVPADQNNLTVEFASLDFTAPLRNRYEYRLEGFDRDWIPADPIHRVLRYTNLPPGRYTLVLRGSNRDGLWAPAREVRIRVLPTWYQTAWFRIIAFILGLVLLFGLFLLTTAYMRRQQRELERQVALRTAELEQKTVELKLSQQKLEHMAYTDSLTGLPNRRMFTEHFRRLLALKRRQQGTFALLLMDFDDFKSINDTYGHDAGDAVLKEMAIRMSAVVRESDCLARLGGDEYGLILGQSPDIEATESVCQKIVESFVEPIIFRGVELRTSPSVGVALYPADGRTQDKLYKTADLALYDAKRNGGNGCAWSHGSSTRTQLQ
jgi:diguanylate cyclase (GGDEF)-like protein